MTWVVQLCLSILLMAVGIGFTLLAIRAADRELDAPGIPGPGSTVRIIASFLLFVLGAMWFAGL